MFYVSYVSTLVETNLRWVNSWFSKKRKLEQTEMLKFSVSFSEKSKNETENYTENFTLKLTRLDIKHG